MSSMGLDRRYRNFLVRKKFALRVRNVVARWLAFRGLTREGDRTDVVRLGSGYGGWVLPLQLPATGAVCYSGGVGEDISFDLALIERCGCRVWAFDPTPRSRQFVVDLARRNVLPEEFEFCATGLWSQRARLRFFAPADPSHVSHSITNLQGTRDYFEADCRSIGEIARGLHHDSIDLLKLDIEGAEHEVLESMLQDGILPRILCVEFDQPASVKRVRRTVQSLLGSGYEMVWLEGWNCTFVRDHRWFQGAGA